MALGVLPTSVSTPLAFASDFAVLALNYVVIDMQEVLPLVLRMATDPVPNIRFNVSKTLEKMAPRLEVGNMLLFGFPCFAAFVVF